MAFPQNGAATYNHVDLVHGCLRPSWSIAIHATILGQTTTTKPTTASSEDYPILCVYIYCETMETGSYQ